MNQRLMDLARKMAKKSDHRDHKIGGVLAKRSKIISVGHNKTKTHPKSNTIYRTTHCELDCILGADPDDLKGSTIYLYRETKAGYPSMSRSCRFCYELLVRSGVKEMVYSVDGSYRRELL